MDLNNKNDRKALEKRILDDINEYCKVLYSSGHRNHLGASELGENCHRKLWYKFRWAKKEDFDGRILRLFNVGHSAEARFISYLRGVGFEVKEFEKDILHRTKDGQYYYDDEYSEDAINSELDLHRSIAFKQDVKPTQWRIVGSKGHYGGSLDGLCKAPVHYGLDEDLIFLNEFKTNNTGKGYTSVSANDELGKSKPKHYAQMCQYGYHYKSKYGIYLIENKNDSDITIKIVELDWNYGAALSRKAEEIIFSKEAPPRIAENPAYTDCTFCTFLDICHHGEVPETNCRSCRHASPIDDGQWNCSRFNGKIPDEFIKIGCSDWNAI
jgi:hypothetical protein